MNELTEEEKLIARYLDCILDAAIQGNFVEVRKFAKLIHKQSMKDKKKVLN